MHCELIVPALLPASDSERHALAGIRLPCLERLLGRGRSNRHAAAGLECWLAGVFSLKDTALAAGALTLLAYGGEPGEACWLRADPVHLNLQRDGLTLIPADGFSLSGEEASALVEALNRHFAGEFEIQAPHPERWCLRAAGAVVLEGEAPLALAGADVNSNLPRGADSARWHAVLNEAQMLLHAHPVNAARESRGEPAINSLWFWGAGTLSQAVRGSWHSLTADDPVALGLARAAGMRHRALPESANEWLARAPEEGRHAILLDALRAPRALRDIDAWHTRLRSLEERWFAPLLATLKSGRIGMLSVQFPDAEVSFETIRGDLRRFWRRARPLSAYGA